MTSKNETTNSPIHRFMNLKCCIKCCIYILKTFCTLNSRIVEYHDCMKIEGKFVKTLLHKTKVIKSKKCGLKHLRISEKSSTRMISLTRWVGERSSTEWTVLNRVLQASLWKQIITLVVGKSDRKRPGALHHSSRGSGRVRCKEMIWKI